MSGGREAFPCDEDDGSGVTIDHAWADADRPADQVSDRDDITQCSNCGWTRGELLKRAAEPRVCGECGRPRPQQKPPEPTAAITHCAECHGPFSLDEIGAMFHEANMLDSNHARRLRRVIVEDLITALRTAQAAAEAP